jgi:hypothetical protein
VLFNENGSIPSELKIYQLPLTSYQEPMKTIDLRSIPLLGGGTISVTSIGRVGLAPDPFSRFVWVGDTEHNRILRIRHPLTNPIVDVILGQHDATSYDPNQGLGQPGADTLACPGGITLDRYGNLWISDSNIEICGNVRLLKFNEERFPLDITQPIFAPTADVTLPNLGSYEPGFDSKNRMVLGFNAYAWNGRFPFVYSRPLTSSVSSGQLNDYYQMPFSMSFDEDDNLYIADINRGTVYVYLKPLVDFDYDQGPALTLPPCPDGDLGNLDCDSAGLIDETDLSTLLSSWAPFGPVPTPVGNQHSADISPVGGDGKVDSSDLSALLVHWKVQ